MPNTAKITAPDPRLMGRADEDRNSRFYRRMFLVRHFEETLLRLFEEGILNGTTHACIGQEADAVGIMEHLKLEDHVFSNHRCHGHYLARTGDARGLLGEIMGHEAGICSGLGGSQHISAPGFKSNGVQGGIVPAAAGIAWAEKLRQTENISVVFIGDGTLGEGIVYETLNIAALWELPLWIILEDNGWAQSTPLPENFSGSMRARFEAFDIPVRELESTDVLEIEGAAHKELGILRHEHTPRVMIIHTYRLCSHSKNDDARPVSEIEERRKCEPLVVHGARLDTELRCSIEQEVEAGILDAVTALREAG